MSISLATLMDVLDRADAQTVLTPTTRVRLLKAAQALGTVHPEHVLAAAVDAHLADVTAAGGTLPVPVRPKQGPMDFGWDRPSTEAERHAHLERGWRAWFGKRSAGRAFSRLAVRTAGVIFGGGLIAGLVLDPRVDTMIGVAVASGALGLLVAAFVDAFVDHCAKVRAQYEPCLLNEHELTTFLTCDATRPYLRALLASGVPHILNQDRLELHERVRCHKEEVQERKRVAALSRLTDAQRQRLQQWMHHPAN
jgi:hypothetical protein